MNFIEKSNKVLLFIAAIIVIIAIARMVNIHVQKCHVDKPNTNIIKG